MELLILIVFAVPSDVISSQRFDSKLYSWTSHYFCVHLNGYVKCNRLFHVLICQNIILNRCKKIHASVCLFVCLSFITDLLVLILFLHADRYHIHSGSEDSLASLPFSKRKPGEVEIRLTSASKTSQNTSSVSRATQNLPGASSAQFLNPLDADNNLRSASRTGQNRLRSPSRVSQGLSEGSTKRTGSAMQGASRLSRLFSQHSALHSQTSQIFFSNLLFTLCRKEHEC